MGAWVLINAGRYKWRANGGELVIQAIQIKRSVPTVHCMVGMVMSAGFDDVDGWQLTNEAPNNTNLH